MNILRPAIVPVFLMTSFLIPIRISMPTFQEQDSHNTSPLSSRVIESDIDEAMNEYDDVLEQVNTGGINEDELFLRRLASSGLQLSVRTATSKRRKPKLTVT